MGLLSRTFTWWHGSTWGTWLFTLRHGVLIGEDTQGNRYYRSRTGDKRWVIYAGDVEASRVPPEWHGWLHKTIDTPPTEERPVVKAWEKPHVANLTGSSAAYVPPGSLAAGGVRKPATGDYEAWRPE